MFRELPAHLSRMALFKVNTGCREQEVCKLKWEWEVQVPELSTSVFIIPGAFTYRGHRVTKINNSAWKCARERAADQLKDETKQAAPWRFRHMRVHDLKHTFGRRLRAAGISFEDRQDLLGHKSGRITTHYSQAELESLIAAAEKVCALRSRTTPALVHWFCCGRRHGSPISSKWTTGILARPERFELPTSWFVESARASVTA